MPFDFAQPKCYKGMLRCLAENVFWRILKALFHKVNKGLQATSLSLAMVSIMSSHINRLCMIFAALFFTTALMAAPALSAEYLSIKKDKVNVRTGPGTENPVAMELFLGYPLQVIEKKGEWTKISDFEGDTGWIHNSLLGANTTAIVNAKTSVNMRAEPSTKSAVVADVERGVIMTKMATKGKWVKVRHAGGTVGWIYSPLLWP